MENIMLLACDDMCCDVISEKVDVSQRNKKTSQN